MITLDKGEQLKTMLDLIVRAKRDGMIDHREARDIWNECLVAAGVEKKSDGVVSRRV